MEDKGAVYRTLIEYFLLTKEGQANNNRLVYYNDEGRRFEREIDKDKVDEAMKIFDGQPRAIARSTGGLIRAIPVQLVISESGRLEGSPEIRIKVKFHELKKDWKGDIGGPETVMGTKVLALEEIVEPFSYNVDDPQRFVMDFGRGIIPVYVARYTQVNNVTMAVFVELDDVERVLMGGRERMIGVRTYMVPRSLLRYAVQENRAGKDEYDIALENYRIQKETGVEPIPQSLQIGPVVECPTNISYTMFRTIIGEDLKKGHVTRASEEVAVTREHITERVNEETMYPFGVFEQK